ncbi:ribosomal protein L7/L12 [Streptomyces sp. NPDC052682]|uniref:ribosomal protein L7/L12 n=1 Tax=Streptomyces sp. NPDC052682 TaxID=3154954 RepID=UPI00344323A7
MDITTVLFALVLLLALVTLQSRIAQAERRAVRVERKLDRILDHLGLREDEPWRDEVEALVRDGRRIQAIKVYREATGVGLAEAKEAVDRLG